MDYVSLDLTAYRNTPSSVLADADPLLGQQSLRGLPFSIGDATNAFIGLGAALSTDAVIIPVGAEAHTVLVAHRLLHSNIADNGPVGVHVADYVFRLTDGTEHRVPIRDRFEIADLVGWGHLPFLAVSDTSDKLPARWSGPWSNAGFRQTEVNQGWPRTHYVWRWRNPTPEVAIDCIELVPYGPRFLVAAITLGHVDEDPLVHHGSLPVRVDIRDDELAGRHFGGDGGSDLSVTVDRGVASYVFRLPRQAPSDFLADGFAGWGEASNSTSAPTYVDVAAVPSATLSLQTADQTLSTARWSELLQRREVDTGRVRWAIVEDGRNWVETVVLDAETRQPVPCRVHFRSNDGVPYQPHGHHGHVNSNNDTWHIDVGGDLRLGQISYAYIDGRCQGWLPRGEVIVDVARGYEYEPLRAVVTIDPGQQRLELELRRWTNMNQQRWFSGDTHVHFLSTQGSLYEARAEDLNIVNVMQTQWGSLFTNTEDFLGEPVKSRDGRTVVWVNQENRQHRMGHMLLLGLKEPVMPWCSDGPSEAEMGGALETTLAAWADACHAQGGTVILPHFPVPNGEPAALVATNRVDAVEMIVHTPFMHGEYYRYLNAGYRLPLVGGTDKMSSEVAVGQYRTYVRIPTDEDFSYESWCRNLRLGRTFLSGGPLLDLSVEGAEIGDTVRLPAGGGSLSVSATARSIFPLHCLQLVLNGRVVAQTDSANGSRSLSLNERVAITSDSWLCARVSGPDYKPLTHHDTWSRGLFAHTSPIFISCGSESWTMQDTDTLHYMQTLVNGSLAYIRDLAPRRLASATTHHHGEADHQAFLERPFLEAQAALHARLARP